MTVFSTIAMTGMKLIASQASEALSQFPEAFTMVFGQSPVVIATIMAVLLNLILPKEKSKNERRMGFHPAFLFRGRGAQISRRPSRARISVASSANSRCPPTGMP